jgi:Holliday junction resolvase RusA-like endonuclease
MNSDKQLEEFLSQWVEPAPKPRKRAAEILVSGFVHSVGPRLVYGRNGKKRWETRVQNRPDLDNYQKQIPGNFA